MAKKEKIVLAGQPIGRLKASWVLFKETFRFFKADPEIMWIPLITSVINVLVFGLIIMVFVFVVLGGDFALSAEGEPSSPIELAFLFFVYVVGAFTLALSQAGITHIVYVRAQGGDATLTDGLRVAFSHWKSLLVWSVITSTVGLILRAIAERSKLLGMLVVMLIGAAWSVLTYFVVPAMVIDKHSAFSSIKKSGTVFRQTWGETLVSNISIGLVFLIAHLIMILSLIGLAVVAASLGASGGVILLLLMVFVLWLFITSLLQSSLNSILKTLLYLYASEGSVPQNFNRELLEKMLSRNNKNTIESAPVASSVPPVTPQQVPVSTPPPTYTPEQ